MSSVGDAGAKLIAALRRPSSELLATPDAFARAGAARLQLNLDDAAVAAAMRFGPRPEAPVRAVVSVWLHEPADVGDVLDVVRGLDDAAEAWLVEEHVRLTPPAVADGVRTDALANVALLRRPATMSREAWLEDWLGRHTQVAIDTQATFGYVQNPVVEHLTAGGRDVEGVVEELFAMAGMSDPHAFYGSDGDDAELQRRITLLLDSCARFGASEDLDLVPSSRYVFDLA